MDSPDFKIEPTPDRLELIAKVKAAMEESFKKRVAERPHDEHAAYFALDFDELAEVALNVIVRQMMDDMRAAMSEPVSMAQMIQMTPDDLDKAKVQIRYPEEETDV